MNSDKINNLINGCDKVHDTLTQAVQNAVASIIIDRNFSALSFAATIRHKEIYGEHYFSDTVGKFNANV